MSREPSEVARPLAVAFGSSTLLELGWMKEVREIAAAPMLPDARICHATRSRGLESRFRLILTKL